MVITKRERKCYSIGFLWKIELHSKTVEPNIKPKMTNSHLYKQKNCKLLKNKKSL